MSVYEISVSNNSVLQITGESKSKTKIPRVEIEEETIQSEPSVKYLTVNEKSSVKKKPRNDQKEMLSVQVNEFLDSVLDFD